MSKAERILRSALMAIGTFVLALILFVLIMIGCVRVGRLITHPPLSQGTVTGVSYSDGHTWYSDWTLGALTFRQAHGDGREHYYVHVTDNGKYDVWEIGEGDYDHLYVGQTVRRAQFR